MNNKYSKEMRFTKYTGPRFFVRVLFNAVGLWIAGRLSSNINYDESLKVILIAALIFSVINAVIRPILVILTLPVIVLTLGVFMLFINGFMVYLVSELYGPFEVRTFGASILTAIIVWIVNHSLSLFFASSKIEVVKD